MRTEHDLRGALAILADRAPTMCQLPAPVRRLRRGAARILLPALAAAVVITIAVTISVVTIAGRGSRPAIQAPDFIAPTVLPTSHYLFDVAPVDGYTVHGGGTSSTEQWINLSRPVTQDGSDATVAIYPAGGFRPPRPAGAVTVQVNGTEGFYGTVETQPGRNGMTFDGALAWPYTPDAWAVVFSPLATHSDLPPRSGLPSPALTQQETVQITGAIRIGQTREARAPLRLAALPNNVTPNLISVSVDNVGTTVLVGKSAAADDAERVLRIQVIAGGAAPDASDTGFGRIPVRFGSFHGSFYPAEDRLEVSNGAVGITIGAGVPQGVFSLAQLENTVEGFILVPDVADTSTWFSAAELLP